jgi:hypothetical protein
LLYEGIERSWTSPEASEAVKNRLSRPSVVQQLANTLFGNAGHTQLVSHYWMSTANGRDKNIDETPSVRGLCQALVQNHRRLALIRSADGGHMQPVGTEAMSTISRGEIWPHCKDLVNRLNVATLAVWGNLATAARRELTVNLRHYTHANLAVSWLSNGHSSDAKVEPSALLTILRTETNMPPNYDSFATQFQDPKLQTTAAHVLDRVLTAINEIGYDDFVGDVTSRDFMGGPDSPLGSSEINLIPSQSNGPCRPLLVAISKGDKKNVGFPAVMRQLREHLIRCPVTQAVIVLCDHWHPAMLHEHLGDLRAHHDRGVRFLFLMVGMPPRVVAPVAVDLGLMS